MSTEKLRIGDEVEVEDEGLAMLRQAVPGMPPNHYGRVQRVDGETIWVEFPLDGSYNEHSQIAPYPLSKVRKRAK